MMIFQSIGDYHVALRLRYAALRTPRDDKLISIIINPVPSGGPHETIPEKRCPGC